MVPPPDPTNCYVEVIGLANNISCCITVADGSLIVIPHEPPRVIVRELEL